LSGEIGKKPVKKKLKHLVKNKKIFLKTAIPCQGITVSQTSPGVALRGANVIA